MADLELHIEGVPKPQARPRMGRGGHFYSPKSEWFYQVYWQARQARPIEPLAGPLRLEVEFVFPRPSKRAGTYKVSRPDIDNLNKGIMDALTKAEWWHDDAQVAEIHASKQYASKNELPGAILKVTKLIG